MERKAIGYVLIHYMTEGKSTNSFRIYAGRKKGIEAIHRRYERATIKEWSESTESEVKREREEGAGREEG